MTVPSAMSFDVLGALPIRRAIEADLEGCVDVIRRAYLGHDEGKAVVPHSSFLRMPDAPTARIIALPAHLAAPWHVSGIKWIASYPENVERGLPRASAVLVLNRADNGYPYALLEASVISAARTAASAALAAFELRGRSRRVRALGFVGTGLIARWVRRFLLGTGFEVDEIHVHDLSAASARAFADELAGLAPSARVHVAPDADRVLSACEMTVLATVAPRPYVHDPAVLGHAPVVLNLSLRDLAPELLLAAQNFVDDVDHVLRAETSPHLAQQASGHTDFITGTLADLLRGRAAADPSRPVIFSPFGLGMLDLALGSHVFERAAAAGATRPVPGFFDGVER